jgi:hypothetical protein
MITERFEFNIKVMAGLREYPVDKADISDLDIHGVASPVRFHSQDNRLKGDCRQYRTGCWTRS